MRDGGARERRPTRHGRSILAVIGLLIALRAPAQGSDENGEFRFFPPAGWAPVDDMQANFTSGLVRQTWGFRLDAQTSFAVLATVISEKRPKPVHELHDSFARGIIEATASDDPPPKVSRSESATTSEVRFALTRRGIAVWQRCLGWVDRERTLHSICGVCGAPDTIGAACAQALTSIEIIVPESMRLPIERVAAGPAPGSTDEPRPLALTIVAIAGALGAVGLAIFFGLRRGRRPS